MQNVDETFLTQDRLARPVLLDWLRTERPAVRAPATLELDPRVRERATRGTRPHSLEPIVQIALVLAFGALLATTLLVPNWPALGAGWFTLGTGFFAYTLVGFAFALGYRPIKATSTARLPRMTVVVPAFNEGPMVQNAIASALASDYPHDRLEIIVIDDGSTDDTWSYVEAAAAAHPNLVRAVRQPKNAGKREALRLGFSQATGDIVVTMDSDSRIARDALRELAAPLVRDPRVGAVAGKVVVLNRYESALTRLLSARFYVTFDLGRAVQSRFGAVLCCPGALTAYRRSSVLAVLDGWASQTFLGAPCTIGEDRALTTWLLRTGNRTVYQRTAVVETLVPTRLRGVVKMMLRWARGDARESFVLLPLLFKRWRTEDRWWPTLEIAIDVLAQPIVLLLGLFTLHHVHLTTDGVLRTLAIPAVVAVLQALLSARNERRADVVYNLAYVALAVVGLQWIAPYSWLTIKNGRWMTR